MTGGAGEPVLWERHGAVGIVTLNRPERRNAIDLHLRVALARMIATGAADPEVRALVLTGAGGSFCSGGDLTTMERQPAAAAVERARVAARVVQVLWDCGLPTVAAVEGAAYGAGLSLALACDRVVAAADARVSTSFLRVGLAGDMGIFATLPARVGPARAKQLLMFPTVMTGAQAVTDGIFDRTVPPGTALEHAIEDAATLAAGPPLGLRGILGMLQRWPQAPREVLEAEIRLQAELFATRDFAEGVSAHRERRSARFEGR